MPISQSAPARQIGINATRLFSVLYGVTLNVGRVMSPTLALLVQREADIQAFTSKPFYVPEIDVYKRQLRGWKFEQEGNNVYISAKKVLVSFLFSSGQYQTSIDIDGIENVYLGGQMIWNSK